MNIKKFLLVSVLSASLISISGCQSEQSVSPDSSPDLESELPVMTIEEVAENDGRDGRNAYVIVDGIVYDMTDRELWSDGMHNGNQAGQDLTREIKEDSPHGIEKLENVTAIGRVEE